MAVTKKSLPTAWELKIPNFDKNEKMVRTNYNTSNIDFSQGFEAEYCFPLDEK